MNFYASHNFTSTYFKQKLHRALTKKNMLKREEILRTDICHVRIVVGTLPESATIVTVDWDN